MDFFAHQDQARRNTRRLVLLFILAVVAIVAAVYLAVVLTLFWGELRQLAPGGLWSPRIFFPVAAATLLVIAGGSLYKTWQLGEGGAAVARLLGGKPLDPNLSAPEERRILNVVEEMAIASGTPVPEVYLLDGERSINAFAAGRSPDDAVVGITRGTARLLTRDELQGVVAHEFSHILNGDMRLNLRVIGVLHGILVISGIGYLLLYTGRGSSMSRRRKGGGGAIVILGLALYVIGWIGVFFGRLIKAGVSRQREFLADAAAVQFTRNPGGIAGALRKIGGHAAGSKIGARRAEEASHLFFSDGLKKQFLGLTATHPPLDERIRRIEPAFDGTFPEVAWPEEAGEEGAAGEPAAGVAVPPLPAAAAGFAGAPAGADARSAPSRGAAGPQGTRVGEELASSRERPGDTAPEFAASPAELTATVGRVDPEHLAYAASLLADLPEAVRAAAREPATAPALVFALLLDPERAVRMRQLEALEEAAPALDPAPGPAAGPGPRPGTGTGAGRAAGAETGPGAVPGPGRGLAEETRRLYAVLETLPAEVRIPLLDLAHPALRRLSAAQYQAFRRAVQALVRADERVSLFEYALQRMLLRHLDPLFGRRRRRRVQYYSLRRLGRECSCVLSLLVRVGHRDEHAAAALAAAGRELEGTGVEPELLAREECGLGALDEALERLAEAAPRLKERLLRAAVVAVAWDRRVTAAEGELLRAVADALDCPVPPFLRGPGAEPPAGA